MPAPPDYGPILDDTELEIHARNVGWSFRVPAERIVESLRRVGTEHVRVLRKGGVPVAGLTLYPLGQWIGGRRLAMTGVNLVGVAPEHRGGGTATQLMEAAVREMHADGVPISVLYPAKQTLYRRAGYELAGSRFENEVRLADLGFGDRDLEVRAIDPAGMDAVRAVHRAYSRVFTGPIDRPPFMWQRVTEPHGREVRGYLVEGDEGCEGYAFVEELPGEGFHYRLQLTDLAAVTGRASRRLLRFLGDHATLGETVTWHGDPTDVAFLAMPEQTWRTRVSFRWMLRILDASTALEQRGYPPHLELELDLRLEDPLLRGNNATLRLEISGGRGSVRPGGRGTLNTGVRGLAAIYTGYLTPAKARQAGLLDGPAETLARAAAIFASGTPWMSDMF